MFPIEKIRADFPILQRVVNGKPLIYFDNAATSQTPKIVIDAIVDYYMNYNANIHRGVHTLSQEATDKYEQARETLKTHFNAKYAYEMIFTSGTTHGINIIASGFSNLLTGTGTPVWGGLSSAQAAAILRGLRGINMKGGDVVEVSPPFDTTGATAIAGAHVGMELMCLYCWNLRASRA